MTFMSGNDREINMDNADNQSDNLLPVEKF